MARKRKKTKKENIDATRRDMLKMGASAAVLGPIMLTSRKSFAFQDPQPSTGDGGDGGGAPAPTPPVLCATAPLHSPAHTPFLDNLPVPATASPTTLFPAPTQNANTPVEAPRAPHQRWAQFLPQKKYQLTARASTHRFHTNFSPSYVWGFNGVYPSPTPRLNYGQPAIVRFKNNLPLSDGTFGDPRLTVHLHNGHTGSESDGFAGDFVGFGPGFFKDNHYVSAYAGIDAFGLNDGVWGNPLEAMHTHWFHDHHAGVTLNNNFMGLNGMYILYDRRDPGHENATAGSLRLPGLYGQTDIPLILTHKKFCDTDAARGRTEMFESTVGTDKWIVNGKIQPKMGVRRRKYRFRILNTGPTKNWDLRLVGPTGAQAPWTVVAVDANFLHEPWQMPDGTVTPQNLNLPIASRYDIIIDFSQFQVGQSLYLRENTTMFVSDPAPAPIFADLPVGNVLVRFDVVGNATIPDTPPIPNTLVELPSLTTPTDCFQWRFTLEEPPERPGAGAQFLVNEREFDANRVDWVVLKGSTEDWELRNDVIASNWVHPIHIHFEEGRIFERTIRRDVGLPTEHQEVQTLRPDEATNNARRDVYILPGENSVKLRMQFRDFVGRYLIHCHNMAHEDAFMMVRWDIVATRAELDARRQEIAQNRAAHGVPPNVPCGERRS
jgi:FtsP/CotA-like multicopper oxidase with cupredoxin domain